MDGYISAALQLRPRLAIACAVLFACTALPLGATASAPLSASLHVTVHGPGRVTSSPAGIDCPSTCTAAFDAPSQVRLTAQVGPGGVFTGWGGPCQANGAVCDLTLAGDTSIEAGFALAAPAPPPPPEPPPPPAPAPPPPPEPPPPPPPGPPPPPPPGGPPPGPPPGLSVFSEIDNELRRLVPASIAFNAPTTMRLDHTAHIQLLLSPAVSIPHLKSRITAIGEREGATIRVSPLMEAQLTGLHFDIEANTPEQQPVSNVAPTEWSWDVEPTETGNQELHLTLTAILSVGGHKQPRTIRTFDKVLKIHVTWYDRISGFVSDNWKWLWTAIFVPVGVWAARRYQSRRRPA